MLRKRFIKNVAFVVLFAVLSVATPSFNYRASFWDVNQAIAGESGAIGDISSIVDDTPNKITGWIFKQIAVKFGVEPGLRYLCRKWRDEGMYYFEIKEKINGYNKWGIISDETTKNVIDYIDKGMED